VLLRLLKEVLTTPERVVAIQPDDLDRLRLVTPHALSLA
jgi:hypothetical protein